MNASAAGIAHANSPIRSSSPNPTAVGPRILLLDKDPISGPATAALLRGLGYDCHLPEESEYTFRAEQYSKFQIALLRMDAGDSPTPMPVRDVKLFNSEIECIAYGGAGDARAIASVMREYQVYDFLFEPLDPARLKKAVDDAFTLHNHRRRTLDFDENEKRFHEKVVSIFDWKSELHARHSDGAALSLIKQLNASFFSGGGIGSLLTAISMVMGEAKLDPKTSQYSVAEDIYGIMEENYDLALRKVKALSDAHRELAASNPANAPLRIGVLPAILYDHIAELEPMLAIKEQQIIVGNPPPSFRDRYINFDENKMRTVLTELYINAMKYSGRNDIIYTLLLARGDSFELKILNPAYPNKIGTVGIAEEDELKVFEPFRRNSAELHEEYDMEIFDSGMGLAVVKKIVENHGASIYIHTIKNYAAQERENDVCVTIRFPAR